MFGYIKPCRGQIGEKNFAVFNAYYCGLCKAMGKCCSQASRLGLNYDVTFLALVLSSASDDKYEEHSERCIIHPFSKKVCVKDDAAVDYSAYMGVMLSYLKFADDWHDEKSLKALLCMAFFKAGVHKAKKKYGEEYLYIKERLNELSKLENEKSGDIDKCADCFAKILKRLFAPDFIKDENTRRALEWMGYNIGRWIFVLDALDDIKNDFRTGSYNPFLKDFDGGNIELYCCQKAKELETTLTLTLENAASGFDLLELYKNNETIGKIIYDSLRIKQAQILKKYIGENNGSI